MDAALEERVEALETVLLANEQGNKRKLELAQKVEQLQQSLLSKISELSHWESFIAKYNALNKVPFDFDASLPLDLNTKIALICSYEEILRGCDKSAAQLSTLMPILDSTNIHSIPQASTALAPLRTVHLDQLEACTLLHGKVEALLDSYNNTVNLLSLQFVVYDQVLADLEKRLDTIGKEGGIAT